LTAIITLVGVEGRIHAHVPTRPATSGHRDANMTFTLTGRTPVFLSSYPGQWLSGAFLVAMCPPHYWFICQCCCFALLLMTIPYLSSLDPVGCIGRRWSMPAVAHLGGKLIRPMSSTIRPCFFSASGSDSALPLTTLQVLLSCSRQLMRSEVSSSSDLVSQSLPRHGAHR
jgi:hypothetical protein